MGGMWVSLKSTIMALAHVASTVVPLLTCELTAAGLPPTVSVSRLFSSLMIQLVRGVRSTRLAERSWNRNE